MGAFSAGVFASLGGPAIVGHDAPLPVATAARLLFLKTNLGHFPSYAPAPHLPQQSTAELLCSLALEAQTGESDRRVRCPEELPVGSLRR